MINRNSRLIRDLERVLRTEIRLQEEYASVLIEERTTLTRFNAEKIEQLSLRREELNGRIAIAAAERLELMKIFPNYEGKRLTELIRTHCHRQDSALLLPLAEKLKSVAQSTKSSGKEFKQLVDFSLNLVNGTLSILWSATQNVTKSYTPQGTVREAFHPSVTQRWAGLLKQA